MSDTSTNKYEGKGLNVTDQQKQEKASFEKQQREAFGANGSDGRIVSSSGRR